MQFVGPSFLSSGTRNWTPKNGSFSCFGEKQKQAPFSIVPVKNSDASVVLFDVDVEI